ncbi:MAG: hypothetical protein MUO43_08360, partial [Desulfobacterales bacterium]|nr:hypothetical protein [Desulfobacterales bacterium]
IVSVMENVAISPVFRGIHPHDPSDFNRCVKLLNAVPEYRTRMDEMRAVSPQWDQLVEHWAELEELLKESIDSAPELYDRMKELGC